MCPLTKYIYNEFYNGVKFFDLKRVLSIFIASSMNGLKLVCYPEILNLGIRSHENDDTYEL